MSINCSQNYDKRGIAVERYSGEKQRYEQASSQEKNTENTSKRI